MKAGVRRGESEAVRRRTALQRQAALGVLSVWTLVSLARLSLLVAPPEPRPAEGLAGSLDFFKATIPATAGYLYVEPGEFGTDTAAGQRLRYELYPRAYDDVRFSVDGASVQQLMRAEHLSYIVVPDAGQYAADSWLRQPPGWLRVEPLDANRYVLALVS
jgi:hypothetical protein